MLNQVKSTFTVPSPRSEAKALVEAFAKQDKQRLYPFELQNFTLGVRFQNAEPQAQRVIVMTMLAWLDQHSFKSYGRQDQNAWQMGWKMREAFLHMLKFKIPFYEQDVVAMLDWSASQSHMSAYVYFSGVPQIIKVVDDYLKVNPMSDELHKAIERLTQSIEAESRSVGDSALDPAAQGIDGRDTSQLASCRWRPVGRYCFKRTICHGFEDQGSLGRASCSLLTRHRFYAKQ